MRAAACKPGHKDSIRIIDMEKPECGQGEVLVNRNGIVCLTGLSPGNNEHGIPADRINMRMVLDNKSMFRTVSSGRRDFERSVDRMLSIEKKWPELLERLFTKKESLDNASRALSHTKEDIKAVVEIF